MTNTEKGYGRCRTGSETLLGRSRVSGLRPIAETEMACLWIIWTRSLSHVLLERADVLLAQEDSILMHPVMEL